MMAFVPLAVSSTAEDKWRAVKHEGYSLMDQFLTSNKGERKDMDACLAFLLDIVTKNILEHHTDPKYQRLKKSSKAMAVVKRVKLGFKLLDFLGFRSQVHEHEEFLMLRTGEEQEDWLEEFRLKTDLIRRAWVKLVEAESKEAKGSEAKEAEKAKYKEMLLQRIREERKDRGSDIQKK